MTARISGAATPGGYRLTIRVKRFWGTIVVGCLWLFCWWVGCAAGLIALLEAGPDRPPIFVLVLAPLGMVAIGAPYSYFVLWNIAGKEIVTIANGQLTITRDILGLDRAHSYPVNQIRNLRAAGLFGSFYNWSGMMKFYGLSGGVVAFDCDGKTHRFGAHLEEDEARQVVESLQSHLR